MTGFEKYYELYHSDPEGVSFCPYRISPLGAHIDHQNGIVNGFAIDRGIRVCYGTKHNGVVELTSLAFDKRAQFFVSAVPEKKEGDWADYLRGAVKILGEKYKLSYGLKAVIEGSLPIGGLSSSAALTISFLLAISSVNGIVLSEWELIETARRAENEYVGVQCGLLDQTTEVLSRKDCLFWFDSSDCTYENIPQGKGMKDFRFVLFFSGLERALQKTSSYNTRRDECKAASYALKAFSGIEYGLFRDSCLRDVPVSVYEEYRLSLPELWRKRADHFYSEMERVREGRKYWSEGDIENYGKLVFESGESSIINYECGCTETVELYSILHQSSGVLGARFSGAGFKGFVMAIVEKDKVDDVLEDVKRRYLTAFPHLSGKYEAYIAALSDGVMENRRS